MISLIKAYQVLPVVPQMVGLLFHLFFMFAVAALCTVIGYEVALFRNPLKKDLPWYEFNRRLFPVFSLLTFSTIFFPVFFAVGLMRFKVAGSFFSRGTFELFAILFSYAGVVITSQLIRKRLGVPGGDIRDYWNRLSSNVVVLRP